MIAIALASSPPSPVLSAGGGGSDSYQAPRSRIWSSVRVLTTAAMAPGLRPPSRMKTSWYSVKMLGCPASDGVWAIDEIPLAPWQALQVVSTLLIVAGGSAADATDGSATAIIAANRKRGLAVMVFLRNGKEARPRR